jgi:hypothetical protein
MGEIGEGSLLRVVTNKIKSEQSGPPTPPKPDVKPKNVPVPKEWTSTEENQRVKAPGLLEVIRRNSELEELLEQPQQPKKTLGLTEVEILETSKEQQVGSQKPTKFRQRPKSK